MKNLILGVAASAALLAGAANATITLDASGKPVVTPANTYEVFLSGASAPRVFLERLLTNPRVPVANRLCRAGRTIYRFADPAGNLQLAYLCELNTANPALAGLAAGKTNLLLYKRDAGGSAMGVAPIIAQTPIHFLRVHPSICTVPAAPVEGVANSTCTYNIANPEQSQSMVPDFGVSDLDPIQFRSTNTPTGFSPVTESDVQNLEVRSVATQVFGVTVSLKLRNALQAAQFPTKNRCHPAHPSYNLGTPANAEKARCMPSLSTGQLASIFTGKFHSWRQLRVRGSANLFDMAPAALKSDHPQADRIHICGRTRGSGTRAQFGIKFLNYPCDASATPRFDAANPPETVNSAQVHNMPSASALEECQDDLDRGTLGAVGSFNNTFGVRWAIGYQGTDRNSTNARNYRFIKVDGAEPTLTNVVSGRYRDWVELTFQWNKAHTFDPSEQQIVQEIVKQAGHPVVMGVTNPDGRHTWGQSGFMAVPQSFDPQTNGRFAKVRPVNPLSHGTTERGPNACRVPAIYDPMTATSGIQLF